MLSKSLDPPPNYEFLTLMIPAGNQSKERWFEKPRWRSATDLQIVYRAEGDITKIQICEVMVLFVIFRKNKMKKAPLPKISTLVKIDGAI